MLSIIDFIILHKKNRIFYLYWKDINLFRPRENGYHISLFGFLKENDWLVQNSGPLCGEITSQETSLHWGQQCANFVVYSKNNQLVEKTNTLQYIPRNTHMIRASLLCCGVVNIDFDHIPQSYFTHTGCFKLVY